MTGVMMDLDLFWSLMESSSRHGTDDRSRIAWLTQRLTEQPLSEIEDFQKCLDRTRAQVDTWLVWGAAYQICDSLCSSDGFWYFQAWLVGLGRDLFEQVAANPDLLSTLPQIQRLIGRPTKEWLKDEWPFLEALGYVAAKAHAQVTGDDDSLEDALYDTHNGYRSPSSPRPTGERWDFEDPAESERRLPLLSLIFPLSSIHGRESRSREVFEHMLAEREQTESEFFAQLASRHR